MKRTAFVLALLTAIYAAGCESAQQRANHVETMLAAAGFHMHPAETGDHVQKLQNMKPLKLQYFFIKGHPRYWFADPKFCKCIYIGDEEDYQKYQQLRLQEKNAERAQAAAELNEDAAQQYQMNMMMWPGPFFF
jgi:hypothetical protein